MFVGVGTKVGGRIYHGAPKMGGGEDLRLFACCSSRGGSRENGTPGELKVKSWDERLVRGGGGFGEHIASILFSIRVEWREVQLGKNIAVV